MICYPAEVTETEISVINDYWQLAEEVRDGFQYTLKQIDNKYKDDKVRPVSYLAGKSIYYTVHPAFICHDCNSKSPVRTRIEYLSRMATEEAIFCPECIKLRRQRLSEDAHQTLKEYKAEKFKPVLYLNSLTFEELISLLSLSTEQPENSKYLGESPEDVTITGVKSIDQKILLSLIDKQALVYIPKLPSAVERANEVLYEDYRCKTYDDKYRKLVRDRHTELAAAGVYINSQTLDDCSEILDISSILYQKLQSLTLSIDDVGAIYQIIYEIQLDKLYKLVLEISKEKKLIIDNTNVLRALLNHLAEYYQPQKLFFTFKVKAREAIEHIYKESIPVFKAKHYFTNFVERYIQQIENKGYKLERTWTLPPNIQTSSFEAIFSQLYLDGHINWNKLSAKEVVALSLERISLTEEAKELLTEAEDNE